MFRVCRGRLVSPKGLLRATRSLSAPSAVSSYGRGTAVSNSEFHKLMSISGLNPVLSQSRHHD